MAVDMRRMKNYAAQNKSIQQSEILSKIYILTKKFILIIDGLDDILDSSEFKAEIICFQ